MLNAGATPMNQLWVLIRSIVYVPLFLTFWAWLALQTRVFDKYIPFKIPAGLKFPGAVLGLGGAALALSTVGLFIFAGRGTPAVFDPPKKFVPHGPYRIVRNPMYIGGVWVLAGWGLYARSVSILLLACVAFLLCHTYVVFQEEPGLRRRFGREFEEYCKSVPRWIPRLTPQRLPT